MQTKKEISEKIGLLNLKILSASKELEELERSAKKKKLQIRRLRNEVCGLQLEIEELDIDKWKPKNRKVRSIKKKVEILDEINDDYYSQEKNIDYNEETYTSYVEKNVVPYNDWQKASWWNLSSQFAFLCLHSLYYKVIWANL